MRIPFGIKKIDSRYLLQVSIDNNEKNNDFLMFINMLERHSKENLYIDFKNKSFISKVYHKKDIKEYPPLIGLELKNNTKIINENQETLSINDYIEKSFLAKIEISYNGVWFNENRYGLSLKINKIIIKNEIKEKKIKITF